MPSLTDNFNVGNVSAPSLIKSAATLTNEMNAFNDEEAKITWENSGYTDAAYQAYTSYLQGRITTLSASDTPTDQTKAIEMQQEIVTSTHSNISYHIQQANIQVMASDDGGTAAGYQTKMTVVGQQYQTAVSIGDTTLADSLESQYYSLSQSYQNALVTSATASQTLANASDSTNAANQEHVATTLQDELKDLNSALSEAGPNGTNTAIQNWMKSSNITQTMQTLGVTLPAGSSPNYFDIVNGITQAMSNAHYQAYLALQGSTDASAPMDAQTYYQDSYALVNGITKVDTLAGSMSMSDVQTAAANKNMYVASENADGTWSYKVSDIEGYTTQGTTTNVNGQTVPNVVPVYSGVVAKGTGNQSTINQLQKMGFSVITKSSDSITNGYQVEASKSLPGWLQKLMPSKNASFYVQQMANGSYQFVVPDSNGASQIISIATDSKGLTGGYNMTDGKPQAIGGQYGFDESANSIINNAQITQSRNAALQKQVSVASTAKSLITLNPNVVDKVPSTPATPTAPKAAPLPAPKAQPQPTPQPAPTVVDKTVAPTVVDKSSTPTVVDTGGAAKAPGGALGSMI